MTAMAQADDEGQLTIAADPGTDYVVRRRPDGLIILAPVRPTAPALLDNPDTAASIARGLDQLDRGDVGPRW